MDPLRRANELDESNAPGTGIISSTIRLRSRLEVIWYFCQFCGGAERSYTAYKNFAAA